MGKTWTGKVQRKERFEELIGQLYFGESYSPPLSLRNVNVFFQKGLLKHRNPKPPQPHPQPHPRNKQKPPLKKSSSTCFRPSPFALLAKLAQQLKHVSGKIKQQKHKLFGPDFPRTFLTLTPARPWVKKFLPSLGPQKNALSGADVHDFRRGRP